MTKNKKKTLTRDIDNAILGGVLAGFANYMGWDISFVRVVFIFALLWHAIPMAIIYVLCWIFLPVENEKSGDINLSERWERVKAEFANKFTSKKSNKREPKTAEKKAKEAEIVGEEKFYKIKSIPARAILMIFGIFGFIFSTSFFTIYFSALVATVIFSPVYHWPHEALLGLVAFFVFFGFAFLLSVCFKLSSAFVCGKFHKNFAGKIAGLFIAFIVFLVVAIFLTSAWVVSSGLPAIREAVSVGNAWLNENLINGAGIHF